VYMHIISDQGHVEKLACHGRDNQVQINTVTWSNRHQNFN